MAKANLSDDRAGKVVRAVDYEAGPKAPLTSCWPAATRLCARKHRLCAELSPARRIAENLPEPESRLLAGRGRGRFPLRPRLSKRVPLVRLVDKSLSAEMAQFVLMQC